MTHKSLKDFLFDQSRSGEFYANFEAEQTIMAQRCLVFLTTELRRDPCQYGILCYIIRTNDYIYTKNIY